MNEKPSRPATMTLAQAAEQAKRDTEIERRDRFTDDDEQPRIIGRYEDTGDFKYATRR